MPLLSLALGLGFEGREKESDSMLKMLADEVAQPPSLMSNNDACNIDVSNVTMLIRTSEGSDNVKRAIDLPQVSADELCIGEFNEDANI